MEVACAAAVLTFCPVLPYLTGTSMAVSADPAAAIGMLVQAGHSAQVAAANAAGSIVLYPIASRNGGANQIALKTADGKSQSAL